MNCPVCSQPLVILELNQVEIDYCTICHGIWLDEGEIELILSRPCRDTFGQVSAEKDKLFNTFLTDKKSKEKSIKCPVCSKKMDKIFYSSEDKITIDVCSNKDGLWFDKDELQKAVEMGSLDKENKIVNLLKEMFSYNLG